MDSTTRGLVIALFVLVLTALALSMLMGGMMGPGMMRPGDVPHGWTWGLGMGIGGLAMLAFWGALIVGVVLLARGVGSKPQTPGAPLAGGHPQAAVCERRDRARAVRADAEGPRTVAARSTDLPRGVSLVSPSPGGGSHYVSRDARRA